MPKELNLAHSEKVFLSPKLIHKALSELVHEDTDLAGSTAIPTTEPGSMNPVSGWGSFEPSGEVVKFGCNASEKLVVGVDSTCLPVLELRKGVIYAARAAFSFSIAGRILGYSRFGPYPIYVDHENSISSIGFFQNFSKARFGFPDNDEVQSMIRSRIELIMHKELLHILSESIILIDGTITSSLDKFFRSDASKTISLQSMTGNCVIGISKSSNLKGFRNTENILCLPREAPCYIALRNSSRPASDGIKTLVVKFSETSIPLRVDTYADCDAIEVLSALVSNDSFPRGYPLTLALSHHLSIFTRAECFSMQSLLAKKYRLKLSYAQSRRWSVLGKYAPAIAIGGLTA